MLEKLEKEIQVLICKLEKIFLPGWFNMMQHLLVHLPYEAKVGSPVQYRWMYHNERALKCLKAMVGNKARVEGCITKTFSLKEITYFSSVYFVEEHNVNALTLRYNNDDMALISDLIFFQCRDTTASSNMTYHHTKKNKYLLCSTYIATWKKYNHISCKWLLYCLAP
jgi:hypothetical protein